MNKITKPIDGVFNITDYKSIGTFEEDNGKGIIRVYSSLLGVEGKERSVISQKRRDKFNNELVRITHENSSVYAILKFGAGSQGFKKDSIAIPTVMTKKLDIKERNEQAVLRISLAGPGDIDKFFNNHPDPALRMTEKLTRRRTLSTTAIGVLLGMIASLSLPYLERGLTFLLEQI